MSNAIAWLTKYWPTISAVAVGLSTTDPWVRHLLASHPEIDTLAGVLGVIVAHNLTAPKDAEVVNAVAAMAPPVPGTSISTQEAK